MSRKRKSASTAAIEHYFENHYEDGSCCQYWRTAKNYFYEQRIARNGTIQMYKRISGHCYQSALEEHYNY